MDSDFDRFDRMGDGAKAGAGGGALFGGEPEDSGFVAKKNSSTEPALFFIYKKETNNKLPDKKANESCEPPTRDEVINKIAVTKINCRHI